MRLGLNQSFLIIILFARRLLRRPGSRYYTKLLSAEIAENAWDSAVLRSIAWIPRASTRYFAGALDLPSAAATSAFCCSWCLA